MSVARSTRKSLGRFCRSVEMITQRPVTGSLRSSGTGTGSRVLWFSGSRVQGSKVQRFEGSGFKGSGFKTQGSRRLCIESILKHLHDRRAGLQMNRDDVEAARTVREMMPRQVVDGKSHDAAPL